MLLKIVQTDSFNSNSIQSYMWKKRKAEQVVKIILVVIKTLCYPSKTLSQKH